MKTIDIKAKQWHDKVNGNSYFSALVTIDQGTENEQTVKVPFRYGYETQYIDSAGEALQKAGLMPKDPHFRLISYCQDHGIILRYHKTEGCKKSEVIRFTV